MKKTVPNRLKTLSENPVKRDFSDVCLWVYITTLYVVFVLLIGLILGEVLKR